MSLVVSSVINIFKESIEVANTVHSVDKTKIAGVKAQANQLFLDGYDQYTRCKTQTNSIRMTNNVHPELTTLAAEAAFATENFIISRSIIEEYLQTSPQHDQFFCRLKITLGLLINVEAGDTYGGESIVRRKKALHELIIALDVANQPENKARYEFLVFNISVEAWKIIRPFLRTGRAKFFVDEISAISTSLQDLKQVDQDWLITFYGGAAFCLSDKGDGKAASDVLDKASALAESAVADITALEDEKQLEIRRLNKEIEEFRRSIHIDESKLDTLLKERQKNASSGEEFKSDALEEDDLRASIVSLNEQILLCQTALGTLKDEAKHVVELKLPLVDRVIRLHMQRIHSHPDDGKRFAGTPEVIKSVRVKCLAQLHCMLAGCISGTECITIMTNMITELKNETPSPQVAETLFDICRIARFLRGGNGDGGLHDMSVKAFNAAKEIVRTGNMLTAILLVKQDLCSAVLMVDDCNNLNKSVPREDDVHLPDENEASLTGAGLLTLKQAEGYALNNRLEAVKLLERVLQVSQARIKDAALIQEICVEMWNSLFPLMVPHLRKRIHRSVQIMASALAEIESPLYRLRAQIHYELSKCEEVSDFVVKAHVEAKRAHDLDYGELNNAPSSLTGIVSNNAAGKTAKGKGKSKMDEMEEENPDQPYVSRHENPGYDTDRPLDVVVAPFVESLFLRSSVYSSPEGVEDQVLTNIQQIRESSSKRYKKETLSKSSKMIFDLLDGELDGSLLGHFVNVIQWERESNVGSSSGMLSSNSATSTSLVSQGSRVVPLEVIDAVVEKMGQKPEELQSSGGDYQVISKVVQKRVNVMMGIAQLGHVSQAEVYRNAMNSSGFMTRRDKQYREDLSFIVEKCLLFVLSFSWKPQDIMVEKLVTGQIEAACMLSESLINRMDIIDVQDDDFIEVIAASDSGVESDNDNNVGKDYIDPRAIGVVGKLSPVVKGRKGLLSATDVTQKQNSDADAETVQESDNVGELQIDNDVNEETKAMMNVKRMVIQLQLRALHVATQAADIVSVQNVVTYFWNTHIHIFRKNLYHLIMPETLAFLKAAVASLAGVSKVADDAAEAEGSGGSSKGLYPVVDYRLSVSIIEALSLALEANGEVTEAIDTALQGCSNDGKPYRKVYFRRRLCQVVSRLSLINSAAGGGGGKGKKGGGEGGVPQFDHPLLKVYGLLTAMELYDTPTFSHERDSIPSLIAQATRLMNEDVLTAIAEWNQQISQQPILAEDYAQHQEMLVECWARLTRANLKAGNVHATNYTSTQCMQIISQGILKASQCDVPVGQHFESTKGVHKRVWRWASLAERYIGIAISHLIKEEGQDKSIQNQLRLASLRHLSLSCQFGVNAEIDALILSPAIDAWNVSILLLDDLFTPGSRLHEGPVLQSLLTLQHQIVVALHSCKTCNADSEDNGDENLNDASDDRVSLVKQQFYLAMVQEYTLREEWKIAQTTLMEAFDEIPVSLQKPLWKWRVIVLSKRGKSVLDGIQKLKESDASLQARVYAILARSATRTGQQLEAYRKTIEILSGDIERVEYLLETAQFMSSVGMPQIVVAETIQGAVDALYEVEEQCLEEKEDVDQKDGTMSECSRATSHRSSRSSRTGTRRSVSRRGSLNSKKSLVKRQSSVKSTKSEALPPATRLNLKQLEQAVRSLVMLSMLESSMEKKGEKCMEGMFFIERSLRLWQETIDNEAQYAVKAFMEHMSNGTTVPEKVENSDVALEKVTETLLASRIPADPVDLISWIPSTEFLELMSHATEINPLNVPSNSSFVNTQLFIFYLCEMSKILDKNGYVKSALLCLAWVRVCVMFNSEIDSPETILACLHFKSLNLLSRCNCLRANGEGEEGSFIKLPNSLGKLNISLDAFLAKFSSTIPEKSSVGSTKHLDSDIDLTFHESFAKADESSHRPMTTFSVDDCGVTKPSIFTIPTWTLDMPVNTHILYWFMDISKSLYSMGLFGQCKNIALHILLESKSLSDTRLALEAATVLAELDLIAGKASDVISQVFALSSLMNTVGDSTIAGRHAILLTKSYYVLKNIPEATIMARNALSMIQDAVLVALPHIRFSGNAKLSDSTMRVTASHSTLNSVSNLSFTPSESKSELNVVSDLPAFENGYEACEAYLNVAFELINTVLVPEHIKKIGSDFQQGKVCINENYFDPDSILELVMQCEALVIQVDGCKSFLRAEVLSFSATCLFDLYIKIHCNFSKSYSNNDPLSYTSWLDTKFTEIISRKQLALDICAGLNSRVPLSETNYCNLDTPVERVFLSSVVLRKIADMQVQLSEMLVQLHLYRDVYVPSPPHVDRGKLSAIEKYMEDTRPVEVKNVLSVDSFQSSCLNRSFILSSHASQFFVGTEKVIEANLLLNTATVAFKMNAGDKFSGLGAAWHDREGPQDCDSAASFDPTTYAADDIAAISALESALLTALSVKDPARRTKSLLLGSLYLADASGRYCPAATASYLLTYQSLVARQWLMERWRQVLIPTSEAASCLERIDSLLNQGLSAEAITQKRLEAEYAFLDSTSVVWQRLKISEKPKDILVKSLLPSNVFVISIQLCPLRRTFYVSAGFPKQEKTEGHVEESSNEECLPGLWCVDKVCMKEDNRKVLQTIIQQHNAWIDRTTKHVAAYGDGMTGGMDYEGYIDTQKGHVITDLEKTILKAEHALEEELRSLIESLESLMSPVLGANSVIDKFLTEFATPELLTDEPSVSLLIGDDCLQPLPWEALSIFERFKSHISRDYSINILGNRMSPCAGNCDTIVVNPAGVHVLSDPFGDDDVKEQLIGEVTEEKDEMDGFGTQLISHGNIEQNRPRLNMSTVVNNLKTEVVPGGTQWVYGTQPELKGSGMSLQDWIALFAGPCDGDENEKTYDRVLFGYVPGRLVGSLISPKELMNMNCKRIAVSFVADWTHTDSSYRRQQSADSRKLLEEITDEYPHNAAALMSLVGMGCVVSRQWSSSPTALDRYVQSFWSEFAVGKKTVLQSVAACRNMQGISHIPNETEGGGNDDASTGTVTVSRPLRRAPAESKSFLRSTML